MFAPRAGRLIVAPGAVLAADLVAIYVGDGVVRLVGAAVAVPLAGLLVFLAVFFRDPDRPVGDGVVSAADGRIRAVERDGERWRISVFMNVTNVHVNRFPIAGTVEAVEAAGAGFRPAYDPRAERNVRRVYRLATAVGPVEVVQITGIVARRLVPFVGPGDRREKGERLGMIVLGSRVDVLLPVATTEPTVRVGERVHAGSSTIARFAA